MAALRAIADEDEGSDSEEEGASLLQLIKLPAGVFVFSVKVGSLCGPLQSHPGHPQTAAPLKLRQEETRLLLERGIAILVSPSAVNRVTPTEKLKALDEFNRRLHEVSNIERYREKLQAICNPSHQPKILKKRPPPDPSQVPYQPRPYDDKDPFTVQMVDTPFMTTAPASSLSYTRPGPDSSEAELRYQVFRQLWDQGNYVTGASNFGADFLLYRGDPSAYHAYACIKCLPDGSRVSAADLIRYCRISNTIKKNFVLASLDNHCVQYVTVTWEA
ncbi:hypothetical protein BIW11_09369 [Tropilaelaps mercedesae]|uniref:tRNA-intron lyase n=1 Tax=Tropilaelaps mercedesae TaxID=418985 RepID=A0A1V9XKT2_9ACAR|nr:hypothetical protein BIW11_09369 [Tropilaelaps mercedesae]